ncbi:hypothetical protein ILUMI_05293 [Ignelater luminosus]|uniref:Carboxylic ester hydrolase n=1 Tax=Ignelater luminosus TaxID=2038154 RepID=A0A8K0DCT8_IGNLU|nr:hypothetical protein ILUMI_05293 [Ignelater luminosus]
MVLRTLCVYVLIIIVINTILTVESKHQRKKFNKHRKPVVITVDNEKPQIQLKNGLTIVGKVNRTNQNNVYYEFQGIPYAKPPVGDLRFKPPVPLSEYFFGKILNATKDAPVCVQSNIIPTKVIGSEDCLYINVYVPQLPQQNMTLLPVMVWIYGGAFVGGDSRYTSFGPDYFIDEKNVIIVSFNYRLGIFGFLSTEDDASPGNYGLKDQILALKWVQKNIESFGGNREQVTIFGESAGSASVSYLTQTPLTNGLFKGAIFESGSSLCLWSLTRNPMSITIIIASILKSNMASSQTIVNSLRNVDYKTLQTVAAMVDIGNMLVGNPLNGLPFGPTLEPPHPGAVIVNKSYEQLANGLFHNISYLIGFNSLEAIPFVNVINTLRLYLLKYDLDPTALVPASMNIYDYSTKLEVNNHIKKYYFGLDPIVISNISLLEFVSDDEFVRPILKTTQFISQRSSTYLYEFSYEGSLGSQNRTTGVGHAEELYYLWKIQGTTAYVTQSDLLTIRRLVRLWTNFAKNGNPTPVTDSLLENVIWPRANAGNSSLAYLNIGSNLTTGVNPDNKNIKFWNDLFRKYGNPPYSTY